MEAKTDRYYHRANCPRPALAQWWWLALGAENSKHWDSRGESAHCAAMDAGDATKRRWPGPVSGALDRINAEVSLGGHASVSYSAIPERVADRQTPPAFIQNA
jgi:hypothetical protein